MGAGGGGDENIRRKDQAWQPRAPDELLSQGTGDTSPPSFWFLSFQNKGQTHHLDIHPLSPLSPSCWDTVAMLPLPLPP
jgi:hypothetical protein